MGDSTAEMGKGAPTLSRRGLGRAVGAAAAVGITAMGVKVIGEGYVLGGEDRGLSSLKGTPRNPDRIEIRQRKAVPLGELKPVFRRAPERDDGSELKAEDLAKLGIDPSQSLLTADYYGVVYPSEAKGDSRGNHVVKDKKTGKDLGNYGNWQRVYQRQPDGTFKPLNVYFADNFIDDQEEAPVISELLAPGKKK